MKKFLTVSQGNTFFSKTFADEIHLLAGTCTIIEFLITLKHNINLKETVSGLVQRQVMTEVFESVNDIKTRRPWREKFFETQPYQGIILKIF